MASKLREALDLCMRQMCETCRKAYPNGAECIRGCEALQKAKKALALFPEFPVDEQPVNNAVILTALREIEDTATRCVNISEDALHRVCDHAGMWDAKICFGAEGRKFALCLRLEIETKGETK